MSINYEQRQRLLVVKFCEPVFPNLATDLMDLIWLFTLEYFTPSRAVFVSIHQTLECHYRYIAKCNQSDWSINSNKRSTKPTHIASSPTTTTSPPVTNFKILVLGAALSGKSTICKQMRACYGRRYSHIELKSIKPYLTQNVFEAMKSLCRFHKQIEGVDKKAALHPCNTRIRDAMCTIPCRAVFTQIHYTELHKLWNDDGMKHTYTRYRHQFFICDNAPFWFERMQEYHRRSFLPSLHDHCLNRQRTTGVHHIKLICPAASVGNDNECTADRVSLYDVGGAQTERRRWNHFYHGTHAVMFVVGLNSFCRSLWENHRINRLQDELALFGKIVNTPQLKNTPIVVVLNKLDVLITDMQHYKFHQHVADFEGDSESVKDIIEYICEKLLLQRKGANLNDKRIHFIATNATNTECIKNVFDFIRETILKTKR